MRVQEGARVTTGETLAQLESVEILSWVEVST